VMDKVEDTKETSPCIYIVDTISIYDAECITGTVGDLSGEKARLFVSEIEALEQEQCNLRTALKKETQFNRKIELNIKIKTTRNC